jgi:protein involved in polysaccharide export with SLBB domain
MFLVQKPLRRPAGGPAPRAAARVPKNNLRHRRHLVTFPVSSARRARGLVLIAAVLACAGPARGQVPAAADTARPAPRAQQVALPEGPLLDAPISRAEYRLGAGDVLNVALFGDVNDVFTAGVSPEGTVLVPGVGTARVLGLNLEQAEARVRALVGRLYRNVDVAVSLGRVRTFKVFVVGNVPSAGVRTASAATRVSELVTFEAGNVRRRNVTLRRASGETVPVDLVRFAQAGDLTANPYLRDGDAVVVPTIDETVQVFGRVHFPAVYEFRPGESLAQFLSIANGAGDFPSNAADTLRVSRFVNGSNERRTYTFTQAEAMGAAGRAFVLQPFDAVFVPVVSNFRIQKFATVQGQVARPGSYPIRPDTTTVRELVEMAGGLTPLAEPSQAVLRREPVPASRAEQQLQSLPAEVLSDDERRIAQARATTDASIVSLNLGAALSGAPGFDQTVRYGDVLVVPERRNEVTVAGAVIRPGILTYVAGQSVRDYVVRAGWVSRRADLRNVMVLRAQTGARVTADEAGTVDPGDTIVVPFRRDVDWSTRLQVVTAVASTFLSLAVAAATLF